MPEQTIAEMIAERRAKIDAYNNEPADPEAFSSFMDRSSYEIKGKLTNEAITTKADAIAVCDFVRDEALQCVYATIPVAAEALKAYIASERL
jgi:hypothetical protein